MSKPIVIVDGYNVIHKNESLRKLLDVKLASARDGLVRYCRQWLTTHSEVSDMCIVFDGDSSVFCGSEGAGRGLRVMFTRTKEDADDRILDILRDDGLKTSYMVISDDRYVSGSARQLGAKIIPVSVFFSLENKTSKKHRHQDDVVGRPCLSPVEEKEINDSLKKEWGIT